MTPFAEFERAVQGLRPTCAVILGSGLGDAAVRFRELASIHFSDVVGLVTTTVRGHAGRLAAGVWGETPALLFHGRPHLYEGHSRDIVTSPVRVAARLGIQRLILTNAAGGIHPSLSPGHLMAIRAHIDLIGRNAWRAFSASNEFAEPYSQELIRALRDFDGQLFAGVYAALTGPSYETPAEIHALRECGADAVGMSTALEAEAAANIGLEVAAITCITNKAAGMSAGALDHAEVLVNAKLAVERLGGLLGQLIKY